MCNYLKLKTNSILLLLILFGFFSCQKTAIAQNSKIYLGGDLSYINELEDCGAKFRANGVAVEPYQLFKDRGANLVRIRLWHTPDWTNYSTLNDVKKSIGKAKKNNMTVLLDFHYSDTWADPAHQIMPKAWLNIKDTKTLGDSVYNYTFNVLMTLFKENLLPEMVQVGNEINSEILQATDSAKNNIDFQRNTFLLNKGIEAVNQISKLTGKKVETMLHIAQPDDAFAWYNNTQKNGISNYDWIGLSYYPKWSKYNLKQLSSAIMTLKNTFNKNVMIVETGYPHDLKNVDEASNLLDADAKLEGYEISPNGQLNFMTDLTKTVLSAGGAGVIYWEPAWISTSCRSKWAKGSHWENATFFDASNNNEALPVFEFFNQNKYKK